MSCLYRIVVSTSRCGREDPGSIPGGDILFPDFVPTSRYTNAAFNKHIQINSAFEATALMRARWRLAKRVKQRECVERPCSTPFENAKEPTDVRRSTSHRFRFIQRWNRENESPPVPVAQGASSLRIRAGHAMIPTSRARELSRTRTSGEPDSSADICAKFGGLSGRPLPP